MTFFFDLPCMSCGTLFPAETLTDTRPFCPDCQVDTEVYKPKCNKCAAVKRLTNGTCRDCRRAAKAEIEGGSCARCGGSDLSLDAHLNPVCGFCGGTVTV